jgi:hypothetical protein
VNIHQRYAGDDVIVIGAHPGGLRGGDDAAALETFREQAGATFPIGWDRSGSYRAFREGAGLSPFPLDVIVDAEGDVAYSSREYDAAAMQRVIESLLGSAE